MKRKGLEVKRSDDSRAYRTSSDEKSEEEEEESMRRHVRPSASNTISASLNILKESCMELQKSAHDLIEKIATWELQLHENLPGWRRDNDYLVSNHRPCTYNYWACFKSLFKLHNETFDIWSHLLGFLLVFVIFVDFVFFNSFADILSRGERLILHLHLVGALTCLLFSTLFHVLECHSPAIHDLFARLDHFGIAIYIWCCSMAWIQSSSLSRSQIMNWSLLISATITAGVSIYLQFSGVMSRPSHRVFRTLLFIASATAFVVIPTTALLWSHGMRTAVDVVRVDLFVGSLVSILVGCVCYLCRVPERWFPGYCDVFLHGHTLMHLFVVLTLVMQIICFRQSAINRTYFGRMTYIEGLYAGNRVWH